MNQTATKFEIITSLKKPITQKKYECTQCPKHFSRPSALLTHSYTHTGEKPYQCDITGCGRRFAVISNLRRHLRVHKPNYVKKRLSSQERREQLEKLMKKSTSYSSNSSTSSSPSNSPLCLSPVFETSYRLLKPKERRPLCLTVQHLLN